MASFPGHGSVECKPKNSATKATAVQHIMNHMFGKEWLYNVGVIYIGDDTTDEDAMKYLKGKGYSIKIQENGLANNTSADMVIQDTRSVVHFLSWFFKKISVSSNKNHNPGQIQGEQEDMELAAIDA